MAIDVIEELVIGKEYELRTHDPYFHGFDPCKDSPSGKIVIKEIPDRDGVSFTVHGSDMMYHIKQLKDYMRYKEGDTVFIRPDLDNHDLYNGVSPENHGAMRREIGKPQKIQNIYASGNIKLEGSAYTYTVDMLCDEKKHSDIRVGSSYLLRSDLKKDKLYDGLKPTFDTNNIDVHIKIDKFDGNILVSDVGFRYTALMIATDNIHIEPYLRYEDIIIGQQYKMRTDLISDKMYGNLKYIPNMFTYDIIIPRTLKDQDKTLICSTYHKNTLNLSPEMLISICDNKAISADKARWML